MLEQTHGRLMVDVQGLFLSDEEIILLKSHHVGGIILFERNFRSRQQLESLCSSI